MVPPVCSPQTLVLLAMVLLAILTAGLSGAMGGPPPAAKFP